MNWLIPTCKEAARLQSEALDRKLSLPARIGLRIHLFLCKWCRRYGEQIAFLRTVGKTCAEDHDQMPGATLSPEAKECIRKRLEVEGR